jgi:hypothetical protein
VRRHLRHGDQVRVGMTGGRCYELV